jgi:hypothetical protein
MSRACTSLRPYLAFGWFLLERGPVRLGSHSGQSRKLLNLRHFKLQTQLRQALLQFPAELHRGIIDRQRRQNRKRQSISPSSKWKCSALSSIGHAASQISQACRPTSPEAMRHTYPCLEKTANSYGQWHENVAPGLERVEKN